jgi:hypothetical protein
MKCNIDAKGKAIRLAYGIALIVIGVVLALTWARTGSVIAWVVAALLFLGGAFAIFEGWAGWCVVRALGLRTWF